MVDLFVISNQMSVSFLLKLRTCLLTGFSYISVDFIDFLSRLLAVFKCEALCGGPQNFAYKEFDYPPDWEEREEREEERRARERQKER